MNIWEIIVSRNDPETPAGGSNIQVVSQYLRDTENREVPQGLWIRWGKVILTQEYQTKSATSTTMPKGKYTESKV